jgi:NAD(P)H-dependent flavin oxidoreductase YrpB (nitropropane dioxygenase family)
MSITTEATQILGIQKPIMLAGMGKIANPSLAAAVSNAGGLGTIGGVGYTPDMLREHLAELKSKLNSPDLPFGVDLLLPQVGGAARRTNYDYTKGKLMDLIDIIVESGAKLFVSAVGTPPKEVVDRLHKGGVLYMNMIGHPKHVHKACALGADLICAQGGEGGGHTGEVPTSVLIPSCADIVKKYKSPMTGKAPLLVAAGGIADGRGVAAMLMLGASAVWVGTRFVTANEAGSTKHEKELMYTADIDSTLKSTIWTGRPLRHIKTDYTVNWEKNRRAEIQELEAKGMLVMDHEMDKLEKEGKLTDDIVEQSAVRPAGVVAALVNTRGQSAKEIVDEMTGEAYALLKGASRYVGGQSKL